VDGLIGGEQRGGGGSRLAGAGVAGVPRESAAGDLDANAIFA
jgi:hypothetical protein